MFLKNPPRTSSEWCLILDASQRWQSSLLRDTAIRHLAKSDLPASTLLAISTKYDVPKWLPTILQALCLQRSFPPEEIALIPSALIVPFFEAREEFRNYLISKVLKMGVCRTSQSCIWGSSSRSLVSQYLEESLVCRGAPSVSLPDDYDVVRRFKELLSNSSCCSRCTSSQRAMLSKCEDFGTSLIRERCFPNNTVPSRGRRGSL